MFVCLCIISYFDSFTLCDSLWLLLCVCMLFLTLIHSHGVIHLGYFVVCLCVISYFDSFSWCSLVMWFLRGASHLSNVSLLSCFIQRHNFKMIHVSVCVSHRRIIFGHTWIFSRACRVHYVKCMCKMHVFTGAMGITHAFYIVIQVQNGQNFKSCSNPITSS